MVQRKSNDVSCNRAQDELVYFTFYPVVIFCFFLASDKFIIVDYEYYDRDVLNVLIGFQTLTHGLCMNVLIISIVEAYLSNKYTHALCERKRYLELNSFLSILSILTLSGVSTIGGIVVKENEIDIREFAPFSISAWVVTKLFLLTSIVHILFEKFRKIS
jgi:hypothetical protein